MPTNPTQIFKRNSKWRRGLVRNQATMIIANGFIRTNITRAKKLRSVVERLITLAKDGSLASRRRAASFLRTIKTKNGEEVLKHLFDNLGPRFKNRNGGYTRIIKLNPRRGDSVKMAILEFVE